MGLWHILIAFIGAGGGVVEPEVGPTPSAFGDPNLLVYSHPLNFEDH